FPSESNLTSEGEGRHRQLQVENSVVPTQETTIQMIAAAEGTASVEQAESVVPSASATDSGVVIEPEQSFASRATHWMDMMASSSELPPQDWFASATPPVASVAPEAENGSQPEVSPIESTELVAQSAASQTEEEHADASLSAAISSMPSENDSFFADEPGE